MLETLHMMNINDENVNMGLAMGSKNYSIQTRSKNSSGAGVNADSRMDLAFAVSDPLSELVWSPHNGLSLKCASSSAAYKKPFLLWNVGPSNKGPSPSQIGLKGSQDVSAADNGISTMPQGILDADDIFVYKATLLKPLNNCHTLELGHANCNNMENKVREEETGTKDANQKEENCEDDRKEDLHGAQNIQVAGIAEISKENADLQRKEEPDNEVTSDARAVNKNKIDRPIPIPAPPLKKLQSSIESNLSYRIEKDACGLVEKTLPGDNFPPVEGSPTNSRILLYKERGKEKALSDGDIYGRPSNDEDSSHESVESCNSAGLFSRGTKRQSCDKGVIRGSKRTKKQIPGSSGSTSVRRPDSSFMTWISKMLKGLSDFKKEDALALARTLACSDGFNGKNHHEKFMCNKSQDSVSLNMGFQTILQSPYCRDTNILDTGVQKENIFIEDSGEPMMDDKKSSEDLPGDRICRGSSKQIGVCNGEVNPIIVDQPSKPCTLFAGIDCSPYLLKSIMVENKASEILVSNRAKDGLSPPDSLGERMSSAAEGTSPDIPIAMNGVPGKINLLTSYWISLLSTKDLRVEKCKDITQETIEISTSCHKVDPDSQMNVVSPIDKKCSETRADSTNCQAYTSIKESQKLATNTEASVDLKAKGKLWPIQPSPTLRSSVAMASVFARRLDALRHITPSEKKHSSTGSVTCFFCGGSHDLCECPNATKSELEGLLVKMSSFNSDESSCFCSSKEPFLGSSQTYQNMSSSKRVSSSNEVWRNNASFLANDVKDNQKLPLCDIVTAHHTVALSEMFHAIRNLRLSRADILRWMNSNFSLSHLNGFFLRLRLGKLDGGLEGTTYYVACISGDAREHNGSMSKKSILVDVGGMKSSVASQYVSNHEFLEDEIKAWWCRIVDSGCRIPSLHELNSKFKERKSLGF